ncbi:rust resistance kinase Lr10-like isoform X2 [Macadamia integrifolia]|uniref:rust resistance kinase Lr10-like isoform X2 n=1 Tax=Macadamia integrifolia TaxID=60698 RepID=UPI001C532DBD|nr:rust resistance kinase Lr10-like isoform X2 [Macadamia integrifolia]
MSSYNYQPSLWINGTRVPPSDFDAYGFGWMNPPPDQFSTALKATAEVNKWIVVASIGNGRSGYARLEMGQGDSIPSPAVSKVAKNEALITMPPAFNVILNSQLEAATVERFLHSIAKEKPIRFSTSQMAEFTKDYSTILGSGGFGVVYRGELPNGVPLAVKVLKGNLGKRAEEQFMAEINTIGRTYHVNLVRLYGFCFEPTMRALVYEYMENGSLDRFLFRENRTLKWEKLHEIAVGTAKGIAYLHEECQQRIIHYDIKPGNVLLDSKLCPKVADFGLAKLCNRDDTHVSMTGYRGTPGYAAPELWLPFPVTHKCDVYSFGMLLFEIVGRRKNLNPNESESDEWLPKWTWEKFEKGKLMELMEVFGIEEEDKGKAERISLVALWCVQHSPEARPLMSTVVKMLEGGVEIAPPPNPFQYLVSVCLGSTKSSNGSNGASNSSSSRSEPIEKPSSTSYDSAIKRMSEIELAY